LPVELMSNVKPKKLPVNILSVKKQNKVNKNNLFGCLKKIIDNEIVAKIERVELNVKNRLFSKTQIIKKIKASII
tara:strand:+ start:53 stop:277 length:225 start_codon:yes stop_codon:yes gene_type:complete